MLAGIIDPLNIIKICAACASVERELFLIFIWAYEISILPMID